MIIINELITYHIITSIKFYILIFILNIYIIRRIYNKINYTLFKYILYTYF